MAEEPRALSRRNAALAIVGGWLGLRKDLHVAEALRGHETAQPRSRARKYRGAKAATSGVGSQPRR